MATHNEVAVQTPVQKAGTSRSRKPFFPATWRGWLCATSIVVVIILASLGWLTNGRAGLVGVTGNSMSSVMPQGSSVITLPLPPREGDYVVALAGAPDDQSGTTREDENRSLVVKKYCGGRLVSTDDASVYSQFEYRGRVIARIPTQKILFWRDKGVQKALPYKKSADEEWKRTVSQMRHERNVAIEKQRCLAKDEVLTADKSRATDYDLTTGTTVVRTWETFFIDAPVIISGAEVSLIEIPDEIPEPSSVVEGNLLLETDTNKWKKVASLKAGSEFLTFEPVKATAAKIQLTRAAMLQEVHFFR